MASTSDERGGPLDTFAEDLGRAVLDAAVSGNLSAPALLAVTTETGLHPDQLATLIAQTTEIRTQLGKYLLKLLNLLKSTVAVNTNMDNAADPRGLPLPQTQGHAAIPEDPLGEAVALDQEPGATRPAPTVTARCSNRQRKVRGGASSGVHRSGRAGPSSDPAKSRKRGGAPSTAAAQRSVPDAKRTHTDDPLMPKWNCNQSEFERRKAANVCLRCMESHPTKDCPLLPPFVPKPK
ncbi:hypothetical protein VaNZ11_001510 [Volvox africanus]|uniref:Uncharacterized protein n=1 Tax=Volvox africanus TaxID=51714 RepID=A0ABQ5RPU5_9CHLO|nr:hypothetical protein VaNZ11_001510 [Volvox africanus]